jgi:hypothetical protein
MGKIVAFILLLAPLYLRAQQTRTLQEIIENYLENAETSADYSQVMDEMSIYNSRKLNLNQANLQDLINFPFFSSSHAISIVKHRSRFGNFLDLAELQVLGFSPDFIEFVKDYVTIQAGEVQSFKNIIKQWNTGNGDLSLTSAYKEPLPAATAVGHDWSQQMRFRYKKSGAFSISLNADKDAGEQLYRKSGPAKGIEFLSGHIAFQNLGHIKELVLGDYVLQIGEGLVMGSGIGIGKSANVMSIKRGGSYIRPYRGINEFLFHRGLATSVQFKKLTINLALSRNALDAALSRDSLVNNESFTSIDLDGLHRTPTELAKKGQLTRNMGLLGIEYGGKKGKWGSAFTTAQYSSPIATSDALYAANRPSGKQLSYANIYQNHVIGNVLIFSEFAYSTSHQSHAMAAGALTSIAPKIEVGMHYRNASATFLSPYATGFAATSTPEQGVYVSTKINFSRKFQLSIYKDVFKNKWLSFGKSGIYSSNDILAQLDIAPNRATQFYLRARLYDKYGDDKTGDFVFLSRIKIQQYRIHFQSDISKTFKFETRGEFNTSDENGQIKKAAMIYLDFRQRFRKFSQSIAARYTLFNIPNFDARIFAFEDQLQYLYSVAGYYGKGQGVYLIYSAKPTRRIKIGVRCGYNNYTSNSSSNNIRKSLVFQAIYNI